MSALEGFCQPQVAAGVLGGLPEVLLPGKSMWGPAEEVTVGVSSFPVSIIRSQESRKQHPAPWAGSLK